MEIPRDRFFNGRLRPEDVPAGKTTEASRELCWLCQKRPPMRLVWPNMFKGWGIKDNPETDYLWVQWCLPCDRLTDLL